MLVENALDLGARENKTYLRVVDLSERNRFSFFYIGKNEQTIKFLSQTFKSGFSADSFDEAKKVTSSNDFLADTPDVILIDVPFVESDVVSFNEFLTQSKKNNIPVIYNEQQLPRGEKFAKYNTLLDDAFDIFNSRVDYANKVAFLKETKAHQAQYKPAKSCIEQPTYSKTISCFFKRLLDIVISATLLVILSPLLLIIAIIIKLESKGPIFYNAKRAGRGFNVFSFYKFRTMEVNADAKVEALSKLNQYNVDGSGPKFFKISNDPRITKVGKVLRNTSLDELPQLFNVLKGDMSLVGNRPLPLYEASTMTTNEFVERFMAPSGITGLWQIKKRGKSDMSVEERMNLDIAYARKSTLLYDFWIMAQTPTALLQKSDV